ncbi:MAG: DUF3014 domain-containing protein [Pseudomonadales bacterium]
MQLSDEDRIIELPTKRSSAATYALLVLVAAGIGAAGYYYTQGTGESEPLTALKQAVNPQNDQPTQASVSGQVAEAPAPEVDPAVAASEPPKEQAPDAEPLPVLDSSDDGVRTELGKLGGWQAQALSLLAKDQLLRRFVSFVNSLAAGKVDQKIGLLTPIKGRFAVSSSMPLTATAESQTRYNLYVDLITALDPQQCAQLYRRYYPLLNAAYAELGEKGNFHVLVLKALQQLEATPELSQAPVLTPNEKGMFVYAQPQLEALPSAQKQLLRSGWENVSRLKVWLRQLHAALMTPP